MRIPARKGILFVAMGLICGFGLHAALSAPPPPRPARPGGPKPPPERPYRPVPPKAQPARPPLRPGRPDPGAARRPPPAVQRPLRRGWYRWHDPKLVRVWPAVRYPYYVGGTAYVITSLPDDTSAEFEAGREDPEALERYTQMQELVDLICQWRMLNESSAVQQRIAFTESGEWDQDGETSARWGELNAAFDRTTRKAMARLASAEPAEPWLGRAREQLAELETLIGGLGAEASPTAHTD